MEPGMEPPKPMAKQRTAEELVAENAVMKQALMQ
eukprot:CAMPEP_0183437288 /NCGR_PEP_ID=MMETSP0370-20130417/72251_1 /TAXON_ID=268820 /ORGANISM="Peridinium aciculiferum, Strain PAER-2" /LENGTH=33 /DNA_ID= /DNA_START= /DNA_END= /DNA_ORIENTATION=